MATREWNIAFAFDWVSVMSQPVAQVAGAFPPNIIWVTPRQ